MASDHVPGVEVLTGIRLRNAIEEAKALPRRDCFGGLRRHLAHPAGKVVLLSGLRRTGKTVMAKQACAELPEAELERTALLNISQGRAVSSLPVYALVDELYDDGYRCFIVDESTSMIDFPAWAKAMADGPAARGCRIVLLGRDSLSMWLARREFLEGRCNEIRTTRIPFHEWRRLLGSGGQRLTVKDYVRCGGILDFDGLAADPALVSEAACSFRDATSVDFYVYSAIALNIQNALARHASGTGFGILRPLWEEGRLAEAIARVVQDQNHALAQQALRRRFAQSGFFEAYKAAGELDRKSKACVTARKEAVLQAIEDRLCLAEEGIAITRKESETILKYLRRINVFEDADVLLMPSANPEKRRGLPLYEEKTRTLQTQPGIRSGQMQLACGIVWNILHINGSPIAKQDFLRASTSVVEGQMLEDTVFADLKDILPEDCRLCRLEWDAEPGESAEFDVAVIDKRDPSAPRTSLFEVKHADAMRDEATKHLKNRQAIAQVSEAFGKVVSRTVVYNGPTRRRAALWVNADEFLGAAGSDQEGALFPQLSPRWSPEVRLEPWMQAMR